MLNYYMQSLAQLDEPGFTTSLTKEELVTFRYWQRALVQRLQSTFKIKGLPDEWVVASDYLDFVLIYGGFAIVSENVKFGKYFSAGTLTGFNLYYNPTKAMMINPMMNGETLEIGKDCELIKFNPDWRGLMDVVNKFAKQLTLLDTNINVALVVSKVPYILAGKSETAIKALKKILSDVRKGKFACIYEAADKDDAIVGSMAGTEEGEAFVNLQLFKASDYMVNTFLESMSLLLNNFDAEIGIPSVPYEKKERLVTSEADSRKLDSTARMRVCIECLNNSFEAVNKHYGLNLHAELTIDEFDRESNDKEDDSNEEETNA